MLVGSFLVFLGLLQAVAADSLPGLILSNRDFTGIAFRQLSARQTQPSSVPNVPTECQADCNPILTQLSQVSTKSVNRTGERLTDVGYPAYRLHPPRQLLQRGLCYWTFQLSEM